MLPVNRLSAIFKGAVGVSRAATRAGAPTAAGKDDVMLVPTAPNPFRMSVPKLPLPSSAGASTGLSTGASTGASALPK